MTGHFFFTLVPPLTQSLVSQSFQAADILSQRACSQQCTDQEIQVIIEDSIHDLVTLNLMSYFVIYPRSVVDFVIS